MVTSYKDCSISRNRYGMYTSMVKTRDRVLGGYYYETIQADTLQGLKKLVNYYQGV